MDLTTYVHEYVATAELERAAVQAERVRIATEQAEVRTGFWQRVTRHAQRGRVAAAAQPRRARGDRECSPHPA